MQPFTLARHWIVVAPILGQSQFGRAAIAFVYEGQLIVVTKSGKQLFAAPIHAIDVKVTAVATTVLYHAGQRIPLARRATPYRLELGDGGRGKLRRHVPMVPPESDRTAFTETPGRVLPPIASFLEHDGARIVETKPITVWAYIWHILLIVFGLIAFFAAIFIPLEYL